MIYFEYDQPKAASFFAAEEYVMQTIQPSEAALLLWRIDDTVVIGANQIAKAECDLAYAKAAGITIARRPSGGGAIFADRGTLEYTIILPYGESAPAVEQNHRLSKSEDVTAKASADPKSFVQDWLAGPVIETIARFGAKASLEGRNDILIDGKKVSGVSQYVRNGYICSHGTLLFDADMEKLARVLTVDREKIETKAIASVRSRVTNISDHIGEKGFERFREVLIECYGAKGGLSRRKFEPGELARIDEITRGRYDTPEWNFGREPAFTFTNRKRFPGGTIEVFLDIKGGEIRDARIAGDFLALRPVAELEEALRGTPHREDAVLEALRMTDVSACLGSLGEQELLGVLF